MKIGFFTTSFPYKRPFNKKSIGLESYMTGGVGEVVYNLSIKLDQLGHKICIFTTSADSEDSIEKYRNIIVYRYGKNLKIADTNISLGLLNKPKKHDLDIVHLHSGSPPATLSALRYIKGNRKPFVVTHHLDPEWNYGSLIRRILVFVYGKYHLNNALSKSDVIIGLSDYFINTSKYLPYFREKAVVIPNGINLDDFDAPYTKKDARNRIRLPQDNKIILFVGSLTERKGPQVLLNAMPTILKAHPDARLILVGSTTAYIRHLEKLARDLCIESEIKFTGYVDDATKMMYYKSSDIFVLPSFSEAFPLVLLEASACGLPIVVSDLEVFKEIVEEGYNGISAKTGDAESLAEKIIYLLDNEHVRDEMGENAAKKVKNARMYERLS